MDSIAAIDTLFVTGTATTSWPEAIMRIGVAFAVALALKWFYESNRSQ